MLRPEEFRLPCLSLWLSSYSATVVKEGNMATPHRVVDEIADGLVDGANNLGQSAAGAVKGAGETIMRGLDGPFKAITGKEGPHRIIDRFFDGTIDAISQFAGQGVLGSIKREGEAIMRALDQPPEQIGFPPDLGKGPGKLFK